MLINKLKHYFLEVRRRAGSMRHAWSVATPTQKAILLRKIFIIGPPL